MVDIPSPAIAFVGRHNSGKTTLVERVIRELTARGRDIGSIKHHHRLGFEFDVPGKDSYRHAQAGAETGVLCSPEKTINPAVPLLVRTLLDFAQKRRTPPPEEFFASLD